MLKSDILKLLQTKQKNLSENDIDKVFGIFIKKIISALDDGKNVELRGFGTFKKKVNKAKNVRNPKTKIRTVQLRMSPLRIVHRVYVRTQLLDCEFGALTLRSNSLMRDRPAGSRGPDYGAE